jgi:hypothetical protein
MLSSIESFPSAIRKDRSGVSVSVCSPVPFENGLKLRDERNRSLRARVLRFPDSPAPHTAQHADYSETAVITCVGTTLYRGSQSTSERSASKCSVSTSLRRESRWDPHVEHSSSCAATEELDQLLLSSQSPKPYEPLRMLNYFAVAANSRRMTNKSPHDFPVGRASRVRTVRDMMRFKSAAGEGQGNGGNFRLA